MLKLKPRLELELMCLITVQDNTMLKLQKRTTVIRQRLITVQDNTMLKRTFTT